MVFLISPATELTNDIPNQLAKKQTRIKCQFTFLSVTLNVDHLKSHEHDKKQVVPSASEPTNNCNKNVSC